MSILIKTAFTDTFRELQSTAENRTAEMDGWVNQMSGWDQERIDVYNSSNQIGPEEVGNIEAIKTLKDLAEGNKINKEEQNIVDRTLEKVKDLPGFKEALQSFITELDAGKFPSGGRAVAAS